LMAQQGAYWRLYQAQVRRVDTDGDEEIALPPQTHPAHPAGNP